jgi:hypothetical protein
MARSALGLGTRDAVGGRGRGDVLRASGLQLAGLRDEPGDRLGLEVGRLDRAHLACPDESADVAQRGAAA